MYCSIKYVTSLLQAMCGIVLNKADPLQAWCRHNIKYAVKGTGLAQAKFILQACKCFSRYTAGLQSPSLPGLRQACILKQVCYRHYIQLNRMLTGLSRYKIFVRVISATEEACSGDLADYGTQHTSNTTYIHTCYS